LERPEDIILSIEGYHFSCLSDWSIAVKVRVLMIHPKMHFDSSILLSTMIFFSDINSFLGIGSESFIIRAIACIASGTAVLTLGVLSCISNAIPIVSSK
jgi:hypothetical protein